MSIGALSRILLAAGATAGPAVGVAASATGKQVYGSDVRGQLIDKMSIGIIDAKYIGRG